jgi:hypothetical protein
MLVPNAMLTRASQYPPIKSIEQVSLGYFQAPQKVRRVSCGKMLADCVGGFQGD